MNNIKVYRQKQEITLKDLSEKAGVAIGYLCDIENDTEGIKNPTKEVMQRIADALGKTVPAVFFPETEVGRRADIIDELIQADEVIK